MGVRCVTARTCPRGAQMQTNRRAVAEKRVDGGRTRDVFQSFEYILPPRLQTAADPLETLRQKVPAVSCLRL